MVIPFHIAFYFSTTVGIEFYARLIHYFCYGAGKKDGGSNTWHSLSVAPGIWLRGATLGLGVGGSGGAINSDLAGLLLNPAP